MCNKRITGGSWLLLEENVNNSNRAVKRLLQLSGKNKGVAALQQYINVGGYFNKFLIIRIDTLDEIIPNIPKTNYVNLYIRL